MQTDDRLWAALAQLEGRLRAVHDPALDMLQPGAAIEEISANFAAVGLSLPAELATWWAWHNGIAEPTMWRRLLLTGTPLPWQDALRARKEMLDLAARASAAWSEDGLTVPPMHLFHPSWVPLVSSAGSYHSAVACDSPTTVAVYSVTFEDWEEWPPPPEVPSLFSVVEAWNEAIERDYWVWDQQQQSWAWGVEYADLPIATRSRLAM